MQIIKFKQVGVDSCFLVIMLSSPPFLTAWPSDCRSLDAGCLQGSCCYCVLWAGLVTSGPMLKGRCVQLGPPLTETDDQACCVHLMEINGPWCSGMDTGGWSCLMMARDGQCRLNEVWTVWRELWCHEVGWLAHSWYAFHSKCWWLVETPVQTCS